MKLPLLLVLIYLKLVENTFKIYPLNEVGDKLELKSDKNETYYFFTPINNLRVNDLISYYINYSIAKFEMSYTYLETDKYDSITEEDINKCIFNYTLGKMDFNMTFRTIIKRNDNQNGLLLKMNILQINKDSFMISRINMILSERKDQTFIINKNEDKYFYFDFDQNFVEFNDIFIFSSKLGTIDYYGANLLYYYGEIREVSLYYKEAEYIYINSKFEPRLRFINIKANETNSVTLYVKFFKKKKFFIEKEFNNVNNIEICNMYPNQNEKYIFYDLTTFDQYVFYNKVYGDVESHYIFLNEANNLDDFFKNKFEFPLLIKANSNMKLLTYFKCVNSSPAIIDLYNIEQKKKIYDQRDTYIILQNNETKDIRFYSNYNNINSSFGYMGCELDENEFITIKFGEYKFNLDKNNKKKKLNNINIVAENFNFVSNSNKSCAIKIELGQKDNYSIYPLKEYNYNNIPTPQVFFVSPKEEYNHYVIESSLVAYNYYEGDEISSFHRYLKPVEKYDYFFVDVENSGKFIKNNLTYLTYFSFVPNNTKFYIRKIKKLNVNEIGFVCMDKYSEYILSEIKNEHIIISIQTLIDSQVVYPYVKNNDYYFPHYFLETKFQFLKLDKDDIFKIVNLDDYFTLRINILNISSYNNNIHYEEKKFQIKKFIDENKITFSIEPFVLNKKIKYLLHVFDKQYLFIYNLEIYNNYGGKSKNVTLEKTSSSNDTIEYTFENIIINDFNEKYLNFCVIATDLETGYVYSYKVGKVDEIKTKLKKFLIIFGIIIGIIIITLIVCLVVRKRKREGNSNEIMSDNLMNGKLLNE